MLFPALVQFDPKQATGSVASVTSTGLTTTPGNLLVALVTCFGNNIGASPITDSKGNTWATAVAATGTTEGYAALFYANNIAGGAGHTVTFTPTASDFCAIVVFEISGQTTGTALGNTNATSAASTTHSSGNVTTGGSVGSILIGGGAVSRAAEGTPNITVGSAWTLVARAAGGSNEGYVGGVRAAVSGVTDQFTYTTGSSNRETAVIAEFRAPSGGAGAFAFAG